MLCHKKRFLGKMKFFYLYLPILLYFMSLEKAFTFDFLITNQRIFRENFNSNIFNVPLYLSANIEDKEEKIGNYENQEIEEKELDEDKDETNSYPLVLQPLKKIQLYAEIYAPIQTINYRMGDSFKKGAILIELKNDKYVAQYEKAKSFLEKATSELEATKELYNDYIASFFELKETEAKAAEAKSDLVLAKDELDSTIIRAPFDGKVVSLFAEEKEMPPANKQLIEIIDDHILVAKLLFRVEDLDKIYIGMPIKIKINKKIVIGKITRIGALIDPSSSTIRVEAEINNQNGSLKAGTVGTATIE